MALLTDGPVSTIEDLHGHDAQLLEVANIEGIDVTRKLVLAQEEIAEEVLAMLRRVTPGAAPTDAQLGFEKVVVTGALRLWHVYRSLEGVYRDAHHSQLNERYAGRRDEYHKLARWALENLIQAGLGMTADPLPRAGKPNLSAVAGGLADGTYYAGASWVNAAGEEGACSVPAKIPVAGGSFRVQVWGAPANARGWNVYVGSGPDQMARQNTAAIGLGTDWTQPNAIASGKAAGTGQAVGYVVAVPRVIQRG